MSPTDLGVHVERTTDLTRYRFEAELPLLWTERLAGGLAALGEDIAELAADRHAGVWKVELSVRGRPNVDLAHLMRDAESRSDGLASHVLDSFQVTRADDGALELVVRALDRPGFLAFLLRELRTLALFPASVKARSIGNLAEDRLQLVSVGGAAPSAETARALAGVLTAHSHVQAQQARTRFA
ncbi:MAG: hypothetical protein IPG17_20550 [Sandaracinaceae bacterium]|nr:hypothetical protein [Sandaracinaceae bacterium]MBK8408742.1 hypothetical protein [Sandaracinaceae bacterium]MBP7682126.1 hypothetical protein [Deltaproteobacteria bacterium]